MMKDWGFNLKLGIISDTHLGKRMYRTSENGFNKYESASYKAFNENIDIIKDCDLIIHAGDVFDTANPPILALETFKNGFNSIDKPKLLILGNHDFNFNYRDLNCSSVSALNIEYEEFADYTIKTYEKDGILFILMPYVYDTKENIEKLFDECKNIKYNGRKILITHGVTEQYIRENPLIKDNFVIPNDLCEEFELVIIGHIHTPFEQRIGNTLVISPGGLIDYQANKLGTGPVIYDTDTKTYERHLVDTPYLIDIVTDDVNKELQNIGPYIYRIKYSGDLDDIDTDLFIEAKKKAILIRIEVDKEEQEEIETKLNTNFIAWIKENYPDKLDDFLQAEKILEQA